MTALWLALLLAAPPAAPPACVQAASEHYRVGEPLLAVRTAETCWDLTHDVRALLVGCQARVRLGHFAHAARILAVYDLHAATDPSPWSRESAEALRAEVVEHTGTLRVVLTPPLAADERPVFELAQLDIAASAPLVGGAPELERAGTSGLPLDAGRWSLTVRRARFEPTRLEFTISRQTARTVTVPMQPRTTPSALSLATRPTLLRLGPARALRRGVELRLRLLDTDLEIVQIQRDDSVTLHLAPGRWHLVASARGHVPLYTTVEAGAPTRLELHRRSP